MSIALNISDADTAVIQNFAMENDLSVSDFMVQAALEKIEEARDLALYEEALAEYEKDPVTYSHDEVGRILGIVQ